MVSYKLIYLLFGFSAACAVFTGAALIHQAHRTWARQRNVKRVVTHPYLVMITAEWLSSVIISIVCFLFMNSVIPPRFVMSGYFSCMSLDYGLTFSSTAFGCFLAYVGPRPNISTQQWECRLTVLSPPTVCLWTIQVRSHSRHFSRHRRPL